ncbi:MAG: tripartite tricarboxylate transporter substrate binding protein, partial [Afipia sp.]
MRFSGLHRLLVAVATASSLFVGTSAGAFADTSANWPSRSIKLIVPFPAGGAADTIARIYGEKLSEALKQP